MTSGELPHRVRNSVDPIRFFFDESCLGIGKIVAQARPDAIYPGHPRSPITPGDPDLDWIPVAAQRGWVVILRDKRLNRRPAELEALASHPLRVLVLSSAGQLGVWDQLRVLLRYWDSIDELVGANPGPWLFAVTKSGLRQRKYPVGDDRDPID